MIPKTIWMLWLQGFDRAPEVVVRCRRSWINQNPTWNVRTLSRRAVNTRLRAHGIDASRSDISPQQLSDLVRLALLHDEGGVWADATLFCDQPLEEWLPPLAGNDLIAFRNAGRDRLLASYFMASPVDGEIIERVASEYLALWARNRFFGLTRRSTPTLIALLSRFLNRSPVRSAQWLSPQLVRTLGIHPYYFLHYTFNKVILEDDHLRSLWESEPYLDAWLPGLLLQTRPFPKSAASARRVIEAGASPVYKLDWRLDPSDPYWSEALAALESRQS